MRAMFIAAAPWTQWVAYPLLAAGILLLVFLGVGYLIKVESPKHPKK